MSSGPAIAAHLILGAREEPFLEAMLESVSGAATLLIVNDNAPDPSPHALTLESSSFARSGSLVVDRTPFSGFDTARNVCLRVHAQNGPAPWVAFVDADEVHGESVRAHRRSPWRAARTVRFRGRLHVAFLWLVRLLHVDRAAYDVLSLSPRACAGRARCTSVCSALTGSRVALPYVYAHYGHTLEPRRHAEKGRHYSSLGAPGNVLREDRARRLRRRQILPSGLPPPAPLSRAPSRRRRGPRWLACGRLCARPTRSPSGSFARSRAGVKARNLLRKINYELRWRGRTLDPLARRLVR